MGTVLMFNKKKELTEELEQRINQVAESYLEVLCLAMDELSGDDPSQDDLDEINRLVAITYGKALARAIDNLPE